MTPERIMPDGTGQSPDNPTNAGAGQEPQIPTGSKTPEAPSAPSGEVGRTQGPRRNPFRRRMSPPERETAAPPEAAPFKGKLSDEEFDVRKIAKEAGIEFPLAETEDWFFLEKILENVQTIGGSTDIDEIIAAAKELNLPAGRLKSMLTRRGRGKDLLDALDARSEELPLREPEPQDATPEEREAAENMDAAAETAEGLIDEVQEVVNQMESGKISKKKAQEELGRLGRMREKMNTRLFDDEIGILRRGARLKFVGKSVASIAFASLIAYLSLLHVATNWATKRVGK
jgi:hypothetical protein